MENRQLDVVEVLLTGALVYVLTRQSRTVLKRTNGALDRRKKVSTAHGFQYVPNGPFSSRTEVCFFDHAIDVDATFEECQPDRGHPRGLPLHLTTHRYGTKGDGP